MLNIKTWKTGEALAQKYLKSLGYKIIGTNVKLAGAEVDIIAKYSAKRRAKDAKANFIAGKISKAALDYEKSIGDTIVFVEVKARATNQFGEPSQAVDQNKQNHIRRCAQSYILKNHLENTPIRFDVIAITDDKIEHIVDAF